MAIVKDAAYYRNRRAKLRNGSATVQPTATKTKPVAQPCAIPCNRLELVEEKVALLEETVAKLAASQAKVSVVPGSLSKYVNPLSKESQASMKALPYLNRGCEAPD